MYTESTGRGNERGIGETLISGEAHYSQIGNEDVPRHQQYWIDLIVIINMPGLRILNHVTLPRNTNCHQHINTFYYYPISLPHVHWVSAVQCTTSTGQLRLCSVAADHQSPTNRTMLTHRSPTSKVCSTRTFSISSRTTLSKIHHHTKTNTRTLITPP